ncbi:MAG: selenocysteine protein [Calditrichaeota bacterium]|nr:selenocysteine protein [Calditrichota bacterium]
MTLEILEHALEITFTVFLMMVVVDWIDVRTRGKAKEWFTGKKFREYVISAFLSATPGCMGAFLNVSLYIHGFLSFGAIVGAMIATSGDESFVMFAEFPLIALLLHVLLFVFGVLFGFITDTISKRWNIQPCTECPAQVYHHEEHSLKHYFTEHIWQHIIRKHLLRVFLWTLFALWIVALAERYLQVETFAMNNPYWMILFAALLGVIPESGPHLIVVMLYSQGSIPFSVLLTSSLVQDGHGLLPMLSYSVRDAVRIKAFNLVYGLLVGYAAMALGF